MILYQSVTISMEYRHYYQSFLYFSSPHYGGARPPGDLRDVAIRAAPVSATERGSWESLVNESTTATWRWRHRAYLASPSPTETNQKRAHPFHTATESATTRPMDTIAVEFAESQRAGVAAMIRLAEGNAPSSPPVIESRLPRSQLPTPWEGPVTNRPDLDADAGRGADHGPSTVTAPVNSHQAVALATPILEQPIIPTPPTRVRSEGSADTKAETRLKRRTNQSRPAFGLIAALCLIVILTVQTVLSLKLVWSNSAYIDEATYLWAGHLEIAHWLHGDPIPLFQTWFSGAPVFYPPVAALADHMGGLTGARILSLGFMIGSTALLWSLTGRLFGRRAALFAAALFAVLGPTQFLGALATYDAMALLLLAISAWFVVAARDRRDSTLLLVASVVVLALANATKYATTLFDPVIVVLAALVSVDKHSRKAALGRVGYLTASVTALIAVFLALGGPFYMAGVVYTTLGRAIGTNSPLLVFQDSWKWAGAVGVLAWIGVIFCSRRSDRGQAAVLTILATAGLLAPLEQARIHTITSLHKHVDFGAWLAAPAAGYALARLSRIGTRRSLGLALAGLIALAMVPLEALGSEQAKDLYQGWPDTSSAMAQLRAVTRSYPGQYLAEDYDIPAYYLQSSVSGQRWSNTWYLSYTRPGTRRPLTGDAAYRAAIARDHFSLVILDFLATPRTDSQIVAAMQQAGGYKVVAVLPSSFGQYTIWAHRPANQTERRHGYH